MNAASKKFLTIRLQEILRRQRLVVITADGIAQQGQLEQIHEDWLELIQEQKIILICLNNISSISYAL